ncbi:MAG: TonB-dependent receptor, partial [Bacteroidetes bacterium]|nr:TonB-dependent receptor [Bacteroidota bacterium]
NWSNVERVEVLKGPGARIYGPNAYSGAINIVTKAGKEKSVFVGLMGGSYSLYEATATVQIPIKNFRQFISVTASGADTFKHNTDFNMQNVLYQGNWQHKKNTIDVMAGFNQRKFGANGFYSSSAFTDQYEETDALFTSLRYTHKFNSKANIRATSYYRRHNDHYVFLRDNPAVYENFHTTQIAAIELNSTIKSKFGIFNLGLDTRQEQIKSNNLGERSRNIVSAFVDYKTILKNKFIINPGFNFTSIGEYEPVIYPGIDLGYLLNQNTTIYANSASSFRVPTYTDLYYVGRENIGNEDLTPERALTHEIGFKYQKGAFRNNAAAFWRNANNAIEWVRAHDTDKWQPRNFLTLNTYGAEFSAEWNAPKASSFLNSARLSYTYLQTDFAVNESLQSVYQLQNLRHQAILSINHDVFGPIKHQLAVRLMERHGLDPYVLVDTRLQAQLKNFTVYTEATNLTNVVFTEAGFARMPGRWLRLGVRFVWK